MKGRSQERLSLAGLAERSGVQARTIRYYIARQLLDGPVGAGRGAAYGQSHLDRLDKIRELKERGRGLAEIRLLLDGDASPAQLPQPVGWWSYRVADDLKVEVRSDASPWRIREIQGFVREMTRRLAKSEED